MLQRLPAQPAPHTLVEPLTAREGEVLLLLAQGCTNPEIADHLCIAVSTVKVHIRNVYAKLHARNRIEAINAAYRLHLIHHPT
ncbi:MAG: response regulator transcription factor [Chloroflexaceae bacterium]|nr:response regulator transcription factor [Chloroflexaceae bacterium]